MSETINFPQPEAAEPANGEYFIAVASGQTEFKRWIGSQIDVANLDAGNVYLTRELAQQRCDWNAQQMAKLVIPAWFRALGPDVEIKQGSKWGRFPLDAAERWVGDWSKERPENYRAKPRDVVSVVNGVEYRWPATATPNQPIGDRFLVQVVGLGATIEAFSASGICGNRTHHARAGAQAQADALNAFLAGAL